MLKQKWILGWVWVSFVCISTASASGRIALVYDGPGVCPESCAQSAADIATQVGYQVRMVGPQALREGATIGEARAFFRNVAVWIQPGGVSVTAARAMTSTLKIAIRDFVGQGGGYVGFCAGAFLSTPMVGTTTTPGLGIFPGVTELYSNYKRFPHEHGVSIERMNWAGRVRHIYFEGGPIIRNFHPSVEVIATYDSGQVGAARATFGRGRVFITGAHPEAPHWWPGSEKVIDVDGPDQDLAAEMARWAGSAP